MRHAGSIGPFCVRVPLVLLAGALLSSPVDAAATRVVATEVPAIEAYEQGFVYDLVRDSDGTGVRLNDLTLIENDAPGAGCSQKGVCTEQIHEGVLARKVLFLDNPTARNAHVVLFMEPCDEPKDQAPYYLIVNGNRIAGNPVPWHEGNWHWVRVSPTILKEGKNEIVVGCDAPAGRGYDLLFAREDEYDGGGGRYTYQGNTAKICADQVTVPLNLDGTDFKKIEVGANSAKSTDNGQSWTVGRLGAAGEICGEYTIRLNLKQYKSRGTLRSAPVDLYGGLPGFEKIVPRCAVQSLGLECLGEAPAGTNIEWSVRFCDTADMNSSGWGEFQPLGSTPQGEFTVDNREKRYLQWQARLTTVDSLATPVVRGVTVRRRLQYEPPAGGDYGVLGWENVEHRYSSFKFTYQDPSHPTLAALHRRLDLDKVLARTRGDFERINRLRHHVSTLWEHTLPEVDYPEWNAMQILDRNERLGAGGMCIQFSIVLIQALQSLGYHARHVNIFAHETVEVYVDELAKWVHVDPESLFDSYEYNTQTGQPINVLEQHEHFLSRFGFSAESPIDWMSIRPWGGQSKNPDGEPQPLDFSTFSGHLNHPKHLPPQHRLAGFARIIPRNDFLSRPTPRPVNHGLWYHWPWNGYVNWYDRATPRKLQYALHSDRRADFYPTLNRVQFTATHGEKPGDLTINMFTFAPNFDRFEINLDGAGWERSPEEFIWKLRRSAVNTLQMRVANDPGPPGRPSHARVIWHYRAPYSPK